jgi:hypothetical protein
MPITLPCPCGKTLQVKDDLSGKRIKCPGCGGILAVPEVLPELEPLDEPSEVLPELEPLDDPPPARRGTAAEPGPVAPPRKKKRKKRPRAKTREELDEEYTQWVQRSYWRKRVFRGSAFIGLGVIIVLGACYLLVLHPQDVKPLHSVLLLLVGVAGIFKGLFGLFFGQFFGEDE